MINYSIANIASNLLAGSEFKIQSIWEIEIPVSLRRCGVETRLIIENDIDDVNKPHSDSLRAIQEAVKYGLEWNQSLITGKADSAKDIASRYQVSDRYVSQCVKLAFLSPEIIKRIFKGDIPFDMTLKKLKLGIPLDWRQQEILFNN